MTAYTHTRHPALNVFGPPCTHSLTCKPNMDNTRVRGPRNPCARVLNMQRRSICCPRTWLLRCSQRERPYFSRMPVYFWRCEKTQQRAYLSHAGESAISCLAQHTPAGSLAESINNESDIRVGEHAHPHPPTPSWPGSLIFYHGVSQTVPVDTLPQLNRKISRRRTCR